MKRFIIIVIFLLVAGVGCDYRPYYGSLKVVPDATRAYIGDDTHIRITASYMNTDGITNQRIYFSTDNGSLTPEISASLAYTYSNTDSQGNAYVFYFNPTQQGVAKINVWTYTQEDKKLQATCNIQIKDTKKL